MELDNIQISKRAKEDYILVKRALDYNDQDAYKKLMEKYKTSVYYMLLRMVNNTEYAEDLTMETFGKAFKKLNLYIPKNAFSTWLFKIAVNTCIDFIRRQKEKHVSMIKEIPGEDDEIEIQFESDEPNPEASLIRKQLTDNIRELITRLKPNYQSLIELRYFGEYSYQEIADELNLPIGTVKAQLSRAREALLNLIQNNNSDNTENNIIDETLLSDSDNKEI